MGIYSTNLDIRRKLSIFAFFSDSDLLLVFSRMRLRFDLDVEVTHIQLRCINISIMVGQAPKGYIAVALEEALAVLGFLFLLECPLGCCLNPANRCSINAGKFASWIIVIKNISGGVIHVFAFAIRQTLNDMDHVFLLVV